MRLSTQKRVVIFSFLFVPTLLLSVFIYLPFLSIIRVSFYEWNGFSPDMKWVGLDNYAQMFRTPEVLSSLRNNLYYMFGGLIQVIGAFSLALLLNAKFPGRAFFRGVLFMPYVLNTAAVAFLLTQVLSTQGPLNQLLGLVGISPINWLGNPSVVNFSLAGMSVWHYTGLNILVMLGGLQTIPNELYESANIDGASDWQKIFHITIPSLKYTISLNLFLVTKGALRAFTMPFIATSGGPAGASETFVFRAIRAAFEFRSYGLASAMSVFVTVLIFMLTAAQRKIVGEEGQGDGL